MKKFTYVITSALVLTCAVSALPTAIYAESKSGTVVLDTSEISGNEIPRSYNEALNFYNEIGEISYCKSGQVVTCIPTVKSNPYVEYYLNGEKLEPENIKRNFCPVTTDTDGNSTGYNGYESISFFPKEVNKKYTLEINTLYTAESNIPSEPLPVAFNKSYKFEFEVDENGVIIPEDPCINPSTYQQSEIFMEKYGNYTVYKDKVIVCSPRYLDGGYDVVYESNAELLSEENLSGFFYHVDNETGELTDIDPGGQTTNKVLTFDASKEGTYNVEVCNKREWEDEKQNVISFTYTVDKNGNVEFNKTESASIPETESASIPEYVRSFEDADTVFKENRGYLNNNNYTMQIVLPAGKEEYKAECTRDNLLLLNDLYTDEDNGYYVYTYGISYFSLFNDIQQLGFDIFEEGEEFSMKFTSGDDLYKFNFRYENGNVINTGIVDKNSGDSNNDGKIDIADVVSVASYVGNPDSNSISDKAKIYCDVHNQGDGITTSDVLMIQQYLAKIITEF